MPPLNSKQLERLSNIFDNAGQVFLAVVVLTPIFKGGLIEIDFKILVFGFITVVICWLVSVRLAKKGGKNGV